ncbi:hypothetical protein KVR01_000831 [Diaporthe batatas]|uniref:uncharacterized protein n=1 Tax=Diaporthe batatas TaxID=748121 RepID=UPI001D045CFE|nr:uncharacterized protein KVR01_000831 [Diaporthe batatas]KAG8170086.1 hypothetical protein KVR01_000831 [Diaporthe batatas]
MQLTETVTIINKSGKIIGNGKHIVNIFKEAKAAYQDKKASIKAERAAAAELRPGIKKAQTYAGPAPSQYTYAGEGGHVYDLPVRRHFLEYDEGSYYTHEPERIDDRDRRRSIDDARSDGRSIASSSRRSHATSHRSHRSHRSKRTTTRGGDDDDEVRSTRPPLTASNLRTHSEVSSTAPSQITAVYRSPYAETAPRDSMMMSRPTLARAPTAPPSTMSTMEPALVPRRQSSYGGGVMQHHAVSESDLSTVRPTPPPNDKKKKKKEIDMNLAYGNIPPDLASRTDLGPVTKAEEERAAADAELKREQEARTLMARIDTILDEAEAVQHTATSIIDHLQRKPEAAAAVALMLAELSTLLKTLGPGFLSVVKGGSPAIFALLASPQFLVAVGVTVGVTVVCFGGWKIVKRIKEAKAIAAERDASAQAFEMQDHQYQQYDQQFQHYDQPYAARGPGSEAGSRYGPSEDDALVLEEELSTIESWRRGIVPSEADDDELARSIAESADLELITPDAAQSVRDDGRSIRTVRTHRSSKSHRSHRSHRRSSEDGYDGVEVPERKSSRASKAPTEAAPSEAGSERSRKTSRSKATTVRTSATKAIEDGSRQREDSLESVLNGGSSSSSHAPTLGSRKNSMLKTLFRKKKERAGEEAVSVMA